MLDVLVLCHLVFIP